MPRPLPDDRRRRRREGDKRAEEATEPFALSLALPARKMRFFFLFGERKRRSYCRKTGGRIPPQHADITTKVSGLSIGTLIGPLIGTRKINWNPN